MKTNNNNTPFLDLLFNMVLLFFMTSILLAVSAKMENQKKNIQAKADFMITVTWPRDIMDDVDTYCQDPLGGLVHFQAKVAPLMHLDRDDLGGANDKVSTPFGDFEYKENQEVVTIRGFIKGDYTVNVHMYYKRDKKPCPVTVTIEKLNPFSMVFKKTVSLTKGGQEETICTFIVNEHGEVKEIRELSKPLTTSALEGRGMMDDSGGNIP